MAPHNVYIRDVIHLNQALVQKVIDRSAQSETLFFFARELRVVENITTIDRPLTLVADMFDGRSGQITTTVPHAPTTPGDPAQVGQPGKHVIVICRTLRGANVVSRGGNGQPGVAGERGEDGSDFQPEDSLGFPTATVRSGRTGH